MRKTTIYLEEDDDKIIARIKNDWAIKHDIGAIRHALRSYRSPRKK